MNKMIVTISCLCFATIYSLAQQVDQRYIDSLQKSMSSLTQDTAKASLLNQIGVHYLRASKAKDAKQYFEREINLCGNNNKVCLARAHYGLGTAERDNGKFDDALEHFLIAAGHYETIGDQLGQAKSLEVAGWIKILQHNHEEALKLNQHALTIFEALDYKKGIYKCLTNLSLSYDRRNQHEKSLEYSLEALKIIQNDGDTARIANGHFEVARALFQLKEFNEAREHLQKSLNLTEGKRENGYLKTRLSASGMLAMIFEKENSPVEALHLYWKVLILAIQLNEKIAQATTHEAIATTYVSQLKSEQNQLQSFLHLKKDQVMDSIVRHLEQAIKLNEEIGILMGVGRCSDLLANFYSEAGRYDLAFKNLRKARKIKDSLYKVEYFKTIAEVQERYEAAKKDKQITALLQEKTLHDLAMEQKQRELLAEQLLVLKRSHDLQLVQQEKDEQTIELQRNKYALLQKESQVTLLNRDKTLKEMTLKDVQKKRNMIVLSLLGILLFSSAIFYWRNKHSKLAFQNKLTETELNLFRSQMNPHFMFNALNSIHSFVVTNNTDRAATYLGKFSRLMRMILENSVNPTVTLADDLKALELYLDLEAERLAHRFTYEIEVEEGIKPDKVLVPPLILQPFLENSVWHGMQQKQRDGKIKLFVGRKGELLQCVITDNGGGLKEEKRPQHQKSYGINITRQRIENLNRTHKTSGYCSVQNIANEHALVEGVRVEVALPLELEA